VFRHSVATATAFLSCNTILDPVRVFELT
jgi:hypothetical protein